MPQQPNLTPNVKVKYFAKVMGDCVDVYIAKVPMSYLEVLQGLEWLRYCLTESIINNGPDGPKKGEAA